MPTFRAIGPFLARLSPFGSLTAEAQVWTPGATVPGVCLCAKVAGAHVHRTEAGPTMPGEQTWLAVEDGNVVACLGGSNFQVFKPDVFARLFELVAPEV